MSSRTLCRNRAMAKAPIRGRPRPSVWRKALRLIEAAPRIVILGDPDDYDPVRRAGIPCVGIRRSRHGEPCVTNADVEKLIGFTVGKTYIVVVQDCPTAYDIWSWPFPVAVRLLWWHRSVEVADLHVPHGINTPASTHIDWQNAESLRERLDAAIPLAEHMVTMFPEQEQYEDRVDRLRDVTLALAALPVEKREALVGDLIRASGRSEATVRNALREAVEAFEEWRAERTTSFSRVRWS